MVLNSVFILRFLNECVSQAEACFSQDAFVIGLQVESLIAFINIWPLKCVSDRVRKPGSGFTSLTSHANVYTQHFPFKVLPE